MFALDWCEETFPASLAGFKSKGDDSCSSRNPTHTCSDCLKLSLDKAPPLHFWGDGSGEVSIMPQTQLKTEILIRCYLYSARLPRTRTGRVRHSKSDCTENKANTYYLEREILRNHDCGVGWGSKPPVPRPCFLGFLILALFRLRNI